MIDPDEVDRWCRRLKAERKSADTIDSYRTSARQYLAWCASSGHETELSAALVQDWTLHLLELGRSAATVGQRQKGLRVFSRYLAGAGVIPADELKGMRPPTVDEPVVPALTVAELRGLLKTCDTREFHDVRDRAIILLLAECGLRASELTGMTMADFNLDTRLAIIRRGKGGQGRAVRFSVVVASALDDYLRLRRKHKLASTPPLWLGATSRKFGYHGLYNSIRRRGEAIGLEDPHPHVLRHTAAVRWLRKGGTPTGLMAVAGWSSMDMLRRYIKAAESELAAEEADRLRLSDDL